MTLVKICGLTRPDDVARALDLGADWLGFIHVPGSPRYLSESELEPLLTAAKGAQRVVVVRDASEDQLKALRTRFEFERFQFHGNEPQSHLDQYKGYRVFHLDARSKKLPQPFGTPFLLDTSVRGQRGGTGQTFDWSVLPQFKGEFLVAGGLTPENVGTLIATYAPWGVDVSSGVESVPGHKDADKLQRFFTQVRRKIHE